MKQSIHCRNVRTSQNEKPQNGPNSTTYLNSVRKGRIVTLKRIEIIFSFIVFFIFVPTVYGATHYVDGTLAADCNGTTTHYDTDLRACVAGAGAKGWKYIQTANTTASAGDTVYIREFSSNKINITDTYYTGPTTGYEAWDSLQYGGSTYALTNKQALNPTNSGTPGNPITFSAYPGETVNIIGNTPNYTVNRMVGIELSGNSYIKVTGINFYHFHMFLYTSNSHHNEIDNCLFKYAATIKYEGYMVVWPVNRIRTNSTHNWIHHNEFSDMGGYWNNASGSATDSGQLLEVGIDLKGYTDASHYNTIENNIFYHGGHHLVGLNSRYNVFRNNILHNEGWWNGLGNECGMYNGFNGGLCGHREMAMNGSFDYSGFNIIEGNRYGHGGPNLAGGIAGAGLAVGNQENIVRYNDFFNNAIYGINIGSSISEASPNNHVYNNTFYHNGHGTEVENGPSGTEGNYPIYRCGLFININDVLKDRAIGTVIKNNLFHAQWTRYNSSYPVINDNSAGIGGLSVSTVENNCEECLDDPLFTNPDISNAASTTLPNLTLQSGSGAIDKGTYLTQATSSGSSSTTLIVNDAKYFQDGSRGSDLARAALYADWIAIGTMDNVVQIKSIDYSSNTITLENQMTWNSGAPIWLYTKSDGAQVFYGSAPDMGAHEYASNASNASSISFSPTSVSFSGVFSGTLSYPQTIKLSNTGTVAVTVSSISLSGTNADQFSIPAATDYCTGETVAASSNCSFQVIFSPTSEGEKTASVNLNALYYNSSATLSLYGSATARTKTIRISKISKK